MDVRIMKALARREYNAWGRFSRLALQADARREHLDAVELREIAQRHLEAHRKADAVSREGTA